MKIDVASLNKDAKSKGKAEPALPLFPVEQTLLLPVYGA